MTIMEMFGQSGVLTLLGMGIVFGFLVVMIVCITLMGKAVHALGMDKDAQTPASGSASGPSSGGAAGDSAVTAAISAAVNEYRKNNS
ncbi:OadG family protein [Breznakiella homolactica]|uniref:OadG family protein n=1 Tax=Breznakiella homolactica TaxID=2798577 RepID=A0A7T8BCM4_9SPIR|nr:OadG family protein [Breznakiella homolactica]QQO11270.1 OadG family protein [Breznakiella homolactica]